MPNLSDWYVRFHSGQVEILQMNKVNTILYIVFHILINYYEFTGDCIENSVDPDQLLLLLSGFIILFLKE